MQEQRRVAGTYPTHYAIWRIMAHQHRTLPWLAERTGYSHSHVKGVKAGIQPATSAFQTKCAWALDIPVDVLFRVEEPATPAEQKAEVA